MKTKFLGAAAAVLALAVSAPAHAFLIDSFNNTQNVSQTGIGNSASGSVAAGAVGGNRFLSATVTAGGANLDLGVNSPNAGQFSHSAGSGVTGHSLMRWDGDTNATLDFALGGVDLTDGSASTGIALKLISTDFPVNLTFRVYENATDYSEATVAAPSLASNVNFFISFDSFTDFGLGADFSSVEAIEFLVNDQTLLADADLRIDFIETTTSVPEPATLAALGLGLIGFGATQRRRRKA